MPFLLILSRFLSNLSIKAWKNSSTSVCILGSIGWPSRMKFWQRESVVEVVFYEYFKNIYIKTNHHKNIDYTDKINLHQFKTVCSLTENERTFFGYDLKEIDYKVFKKALI